MWPMASALASLADDTGTDTSPANAHDQGQPSQHQQTTPAATGPELWDIWTVSQIQAYSIMVLTMFVCLYFLVKLCHRCFRCLFPDEQPLLCDTNRTVKMINRGMAGNGQDSMSMCALQSITDQTNRLIP